MILAALLGLSVLADGWTELPGHTPKISAQRSRLDVDADPVLLEAPLPQIPPVAPAELVEPAAPALRPSPNSCGRFGRRPPRSPT